MGTVATEKGGGDFENLEPGTYAGRCYGVIDIGTHKGEYEGKTTTKYQVILLFETPLELMEDGRPFGIAAFRTLSLHKNSTLKAELEAWRGKEFTEEEKAGFDISKLLGHACMLTIGLTSGGKSKITGIGKPMKGLAIPEAVNPLVHFDLDKYRAGVTTELEVYDILPDWIKKKIQECEELKNYTPPKKAEVAETETVEDDDIPF